jgi:hypothetical protein
MSASEGQFSGAGAAAIKGRRKRANFLSAAVLALLVWLVVLNASATPPAGYYLVWSDEFNGTSLDPTKWWVWDTADRSGYTVPDAVTVGGGYLTITTYTTNGTHYSAIISSDGKFRARYGYWESSIEFNGSPGMFSDFWLQSPDNTGAIVGDPAAEGAEVDICEHRVTDTGNVDDISGEVTIDLHWNGYTSGVEKTAASGLIGSGLGTGFHIYGLLWNNTNYSFSFDDTPMWSTNAGVSDRTEIVLLSSEVDSNSFCGIVPPAGYGDFLVSTTKMVVDYVRYYAPTTTVYWTGASSADWTDGGNWLSNMIPNSASDVVFSYLSVGNYSMVLGQDTAVNSLSLEETPAFSIVGNTLTLNSGGIDMLSALDNATINSALVLGAAQAWNIATNLALIVNGTIGGAGGLNLTGRGEVVLAGMNNCSGLTTVSNGTLLVNGVMTGPVTVAGGTLGGTGAMTGPVVVNPGGTLAPGSGLGTLTLSNTLTLRPGSVTSVEVNQSMGASDQIIGLTSVTYGGTLVVNNQAGALAAGDSFVLFNALNYAGAFNRISPSNPGAGLAWDIGSLATEGILRVITTNSAPLTAQWTGGQLSVSWPSSNVGWLLQAQTNAPGIGLTANWVTVPGSDGTNSLILTVNPAAGSVFFRLVCPAYSTAVFGSGDLVVLQVGNGSIDTDGAPGFLNDYSPFGGAKVVQVALPTTGANALIFGGSSYDGALSLSADGKAVVIAGYNVPAGSSASAIDSSSTTGASAVPRAVGSVRADGSFALNATTTKFSGSTIRCAVADGSGNFWAGGGSSGIAYLGNNSAAATLSTVSTATRDLAFVNGSLYFTETGSGQGVMSFSGAPKTSATPTLIINTAGTGTGTPSPKGFAINPALTIAYVADNRTAADGGGIQRFNWSGGKWVYAYTLSNTLTSSQEVEDLAVDYSGSNPILYAVTGESTGNHLVTVTDTGANSTYTSLETAPSGDAFRGVVFAPSGH